MGGAQRANGVASRSLQKQWSVRFPDQTPADATSVWQHSQHSRAGGSSTEQPPTGLLAQRASQNVHGRKTPDALPSSLESDDKKEKLVKMTDYTFFPSSFEQNRNDGCTFTFQREDASSWSLSLGLATPKRLL